MITRSDIDKMMYIFTIIGGIVGIVEAVMGLSRNFSVEPIAAIAVCILALLSAIRPDDPIPFHWVLLLILAILAIIFGSVVGGILILVAAILGILVEADVI